MSMIVDNFICDVATKPGSVPCRDWPVEGSCVVVVAAIATESASLY